MIRAQTPPGSPPGLPGPAAGGAEAGKARRRSSNGFFYQVPASGAASTSLAESGAHPLHHHGTPAIVYYDPNGAVDKKHIAELELALSRASNASREKDVEIASLKEELEALRTQLQRRTGQARAMRDESVSTKATVAQLTAEVEELRTLFAAAEERLVDSENELADQRAALEAKLTSTERQLRHASSSLKDARAEAASQAARADALARALEAQALAPPRPPPRPALVILATLPNGREEDLIIADGDNVAQKTQAFIQTHGLKPNAAARLLAFAMLQAEALE